MEQNIRILQVYISKKIERDLRKLGGNYDRVRLLNDSTVKLAVNAGIEFIFRMNILTYKMHFQTSYSLHNLK